MAFEDYEGSRNASQPFHLYLFEGTPPSLESAVRCVTVGPGFGEFSMGTTAMSRSSTAVTSTSVDSPDLDLKVGVTTATKTATVGATTTTVVTVKTITRAGLTATIHTLVTTTTVVRDINTIAGNGIIGTDYITSIDDALATFPALERINLVVGWHATDLRAGECEIRPKVESASLSTAPYEWSAGGILRVETTVVSTLDGLPAIGGAPSDKAVYEAIIYAKSKGLKVTVYPIIGLDIPAGNGLPDPYGESEQAAYPHRSRITCSIAPGLAGSPDRTADLNAEIERFFGSANAADVTWDSGQLRTAYVGPTEWSYRRFIFTLARIAQAAGADDLLMGSQLVGLTSLRGASAWQFPAVDQLTDLVIAVKGMLGEAVALSYAADWTEFHSQRNASGEVVYSLDKFWGNSTVAYVGIEAGFPISDWRNNVGHVDGLAGTFSDYDAVYLRENLTSGEHYDWTYPTAMDWSAQNRAPITDAFHGEDWVYRQKDIASWWSNLHYNRYDGSGVKAGLPTKWIPESKPVVLTSVGCPAVDRGANQPSAMVDLNAGVTAYPVGSTAVGDPAIQRAVIETWIFAAGRNSMFDAARTSVDGWDVRPYPVFPGELGKWADAKNWARGRWITGRVVADRGFDAGGFGPYAFTSAEEEVVCNGQVYAPWPITHGEVTSSGSLDKARLEITLGIGTGIDDEFIAYPPSTVVNLTIYKAHTYGPLGWRDISVEWTGRVRGAGANDDSFEITFDGEPINTSMRRNGLWRNFQIGCPHVLYGDDCRADKRAVTVSRPLSTVLPDGGMKFVTPLPLPSENYGGGLIEWTMPNGRREIRTVLSVGDGGTLVSVRGGQPTGVPVGTLLSVSPGCNHRQGNCADIFANILNFGGQKDIPIGNNPLAFKSNFY